MKEVEKYSEKLSEQERQIILRLKNAPVPTVPQEEIRIVCKTAVSYYTKKQSIWDMDFWKVTFTCSTVGSAFFWLLSAFLLGSFVVVSLLAAGNEALMYALMMAVSPVPVLAYVIRELQYRDENLVWLEKTCKYAPARIYFARLWVGTIFNVLFVFLTGLAAFSHYEKLLQLYFCAFSAMFFVGAVALLLMTFSENALPLSLMMAAWVSGAAYLLRQSEVFEVIVETGTGVLATGMLFSFVLFAAASMKSTTRLYARC